MLPSELLVLRALSDKVHAPTGLLLVPVWIKAPASNVHIHHLVLGEVKALVQVEGVALHRGPLSVVSHLHHVVIRIHNILLGVVSDLDRVGFNDQT